MTKLKIDDNTQYLAEDFVDGYLINPFLLRGSTPAEPFIIRTEHKHSVHYQDTESDGQLMCWGVFDTLDDALHCAKNGPFYCDWVGC